MKRGYFISFEGGDGAGKSTQIRKLKEYLEERGYSVVLTREPGGTQIGEKIRQIILDPANDKMTAMTEAMLYAASRAQHIEEVIKPAIARGAIVICDRFVDSSIAYQGHGRGMGSVVEEINRYVIHDSMPDKTFLLKLKPHIGSRRIDSREKDRIEMETSDFHHMVYAGYEALEKAYPQRITGIDASGTIDEIHEKIRKQVDALLND